MAESQPSVNCSCYVILNWEGWLCVGVWVNVKLINAIQTPLSLGIGPAEGIQTVSPDYLLHKGVFQTGVNEVGTRG